MKTENQVTPPSEEMECFFTRSIANEGVKFDLVKPDGTKTNAWLILYGIDSDVFRNAQSEGNRRLMELAKDSDVTKIAQSVLEEQTLTLVAKLVKAWSFSKPCTLENVMSFLKEAPQIRSQIDSFTARRQLFFKAGLNNS